VSADELAQIERLVNAEIRANAPAETRVMGFDPGQINYLKAMAEAGLGQGEIDKIELLGTPLEQCIMKYKPNERMAELYKL
jgi:alanyl-tRNA synthetase